ncbi:MAG TPA: MATE family efflux transporter [Anaerolineae bacterium]
MSDSSAAIATLGDIKPESLNRTIITLAIPSILENLLVSAVFISDTFLIGHLGDPASLAAVGISGSYLFIANGLFMALAIGSMALVSRAYGEKNLVLARKMAGQSVALSVVFALLCMVVLAPLASPFLSLLINDPEVVRQGTIYVQIILTTSIVAFPLQVLTGIMRSTGDTRTPMYITLVMNVINIVLAIILIFGVGPIPALKIAGAGTATAIARASGGLMALFVIIKGLSKLQLNLKEMLVWYWNDVWRILRIAIPNIIDSLIQRIGFIAFISIVASMGTAVVAANQIANTIESMAFLPAFGLSVATTAIVGQSLGAKNVPIAVLATTRSIMLAVGVMLCTAVFSVVFGGLIARAFGASQEILGLATMAVQLSALEQPFIAVQNVLGGTLRGAGDTRSPMIVSFIGVFLFRITTVYLLAIVLRLGLAGVWIGTAIDWAGRSLVMYILFRQGKWKHIKI